MPTSYQPPLPNASAKTERTMSQTTATNLSKDNATVRKLIEGKGGETFTVRPDETIAHAVGVLRDRRIGALVVTEADGTLCGILSERDIVRKLAETPGQTLPQTVSENMTRNVETCTPDDTLVTVLVRMAEGKFRHMPVVESGALRGMVTIGDVVHFRLRELEYEALQLKQMIVG
ncbi:MAG: CBS domain-containing protein [Pseudomonadota bacterium]